MNTQQNCIEETNDTSALSIDDTSQNDEIFLCPNCGKETNIQFAFCQHCGFSISKTEEEPQPSAPKKKRRLLPLIIILSVAVLAVVAAVALIFVLPLFKGEEKELPNDYAIYLKDNELFLTDLEEETQAAQLTSRLFDYSEIDEDLLSYSTYVSVSQTHISKDGKYIFFPDRSQEKNSDINLYYKNLKNSEAEAIKIDSNIRSYYVDETASIVTYIKDEEKTLYQYQIDTDSKEKLANNVTDYHVSQDGKKIIFAVADYFTNEEGQLEIRSRDVYVKLADADKEKLAGSISTLEYVSNDLSTIYYIKDRSLYKQSEGAEKIKISTDIYDVLKVYETGEIYYLKGDSAKYPIMDFITDDLKASDATIFEPESPDYPYEPESPRWWYYDTDAEYSAAYDSYKKLHDEWESTCARMDSEYDTAYEKYKAKVARDELRKELLNETVYRGVYSLCYYNNATEAILSDTQISSSVFNTPVISYLAYNQSKFQKVKLSQIDSTPKAYELVFDAFDAATERFLAVGENTSLMEITKTDITPVANSTGTMLYYVDNIADGGNHGDLYRISITDGIIGKPELFDTDVYSESFEFISDDEFMYFKDVNDDSVGDLYINKSSIDYDVEVYRKTEVQDNQLFYLTDWNDEKSYGTLKVYDGVKVSKIADDVHDYLATQKGRVLYLYDYSVNYYSGELHEWSGNETKKIDDDIISLPKSFSANEPSAHIY